MKPTEQFLELYNNIDSLKNNEINELYIATNDLYSDVCKTDDMKKIYEKIFKNYDPKTIYTIINDPTLQNYKNRREMIDAKKLFFISYCVLLFFKNSYNMKKEEFHEYLKTLMDRFDLDEKSKLRKAINKEIGVVTKSTIVSKSTVIMPVFTPSAPTGAIVTPSTQNITHQPSFSISNPINFESFEHKNDAGDKQQSNVDNQYLDEDAQKLKIINDFIDLDKNNYNNNYISLLEKLNTVVLNNIIYIQYITEFMTNNSFAVINTIDEYFDSFKILYNYLSERYKFVNNLISDELQEIKDDEITKKEKLLILNIENFKEFNEQKYNVFLDNDLQDKLTNTGTEFFNLIKKYFPVISLNDNTYLAMVKNIVNNIKEKIINSSKEKYIFSFFRNLIYYTNILELFYDDLKNNSYGNDIYAILSECRIYLDLCKKTINIKNKDKDELTIDIDKYDFNILSNDFKEVMKKHLLKK